MRLYICLAGLLGLVAVAGGAFVSHGLEKVLMANGVEPAMLPERMEWAGTAIEYLLIHAVALLACAAARRAIGGSRLLSWACAAFTLGIVLFCGSLLTLAFTGNTIFARIAPWGGTTLIAAWGLVAAGGLFVKKRDSAAGNDVAAKRN